VKIASARLPARAKDHQHALLALREHHLVGGHVFLAYRHPVEVELDAEIALGPHLDGRAGQAGGAHVLDRDDGAGRHQLEACFQQAFLRERVADLDGRPLLLDPVVELGRRHGRAADPVTARPGAEIDDRQADASGLGIEDRVRFREAGRKRVHQDVAVVPCIEIDLAAHRRYAKGIAVAADPRDDARHQMLRPGVIGGAEAQSVHGRDRPRSHGEHVPQDAADPGRRTLVGFDVGGMVVAFHLEDDAVAVADVDDAGILARPLDHPRPRRGQGAQPFLRGFVGAVLVPHGRKDAELGEARLAADQRQDPPVLVRFQAVGGNEIAGDGGVAGRGHDAVRPVCSGNIRRSGCRRRRPSSSG